MLNVNVGVLYQHPDVTTEKLLECYDTILKKDKRTLLICDVNIDLLESNATTKQYMDAVRGHQFSIINKIDNDCGTSGDSQQNESITDHVLFNAVVFEYSLSQCTESLFENKIIVLGFDDKKTEKIEFIVEPSEIPYKMVDFQKYHEHFSKIDVKSTQSLDILISVITECKQKSIKNGKRSTKTCDRPWISEESLNRSERFAKRYQVFAEEIKNSSKESFWGTINQFLKNESASYKPSCVAIYKGDGEITTDKKEIADIFNVYFLNIGKVLHDLVPCTVTIGRPVVEFNGNSIQTISTNFQEVEEKIEQLKNSNSFHDIISANNLKRYSHVLAPVLARHFNECFRTGVFPDSLKIDRIVPAYKNQDPLEPANYRPISIPPTLSKLMESIICDRITEFCNQNNIISEDQYGFQKNSSAMSAIVSVLDYLQVGLDANSKAFGAGLFIDLKKVSSTIPHDLLFQKLNNMGIKGSLFNLLSSYLFKRRQFVDVDNHLSEEVVNIYSLSIPQGSPLSPLILTLYMNDIFMLKLHGKLILYADDIAVIYVETDPIALKRHMEKDLKLLIEWCNRNALTLNTDKSKAMFFKNKKTKINLKKLCFKIDLKVRYRTIEFVESHKYLGLHLQSNLKWDIHINHIIREITAVSNASKKFCGQIYEKVSLEVYQKLVYNRLFEMASIYGTYSIPEREYLQSAQDLAIKSIFSNIFTGNVNEIYCRHELIKVNDIIRLDLTVLFYKIKNNLIKLNQIDSDIEKHNILSVAKKCFEKLPREIQDQPDLVQFKTKFKQFSISAHVEIDP